MLTSLLIFNLIWATSLAQTQLPVATLTPTHSVLATGDSITLSCSTTRATPSIMWFRNNNRISDDAIISADETMLALNFSVDFVGNYTCVTSNNMGSVSSNTAMLQLAVHETRFFSTARDSPHEVTVQEGVSTAIDCGPFTNIPASDLQWGVLFGDGFEGIGIANDRATIGLNQSLYLLEPIMDNIFECHLRSTVLGVSSTGYVQIRLEASSSPASDPFILVAPQDVTTRIGQTVSFECIPGGRDAANSRAEWTTPSAMVNGRISSDTFRLSISHLTADSMGTYRCTIGSLTRSATLTLIESPELVTSLPSSLVSLTYGDILPLVCSSSTPQTTYWEWFHNGSREAESSPNFTVESTTLADSGSYQCIAYNSAGYNQSTTLVQVNTIPANISTSLPTNQLAFRDQPFSVTCSAQGAPSPTYMWFKSTIPLETGMAFEVSDDGGLMIRNVDGSSEGLYRCTATNFLPGGAVVGMDAITTTLTTIRPTVIREELGPLFSVQVATPITFHCEVDSEPEASLTFSWLKDDEPVVTSERVRLLDPTVMATLR